MFRLDSNRNEFEKRFNRNIRRIKIAWWTTFILGLLFTGGAIFIVLHFIMKYW